MDLKLTRTEFRSDGIFGRLLTATDTEVAVSLEHSYASGESWAPKLPNGTYTCKRGQHQLASMKQHFETFEITGVPGHTDVLFHMGNYNRDSEGCVLLGQVKTVAGGGSQMILNSGLTFAAFMRLQLGCDEFQLVVS